MTTGDIYAKVPENTLIEHRICVPIGARGNVTWIAPQGEYNINDEVLEIEFGGEKKVRLQQSGMKPTHVHREAASSPCALSA